MIDRYQVTPLQIIELKALMGDSADKMCIRDRFKAVRGRKESL